MKIAAVVSLLAFLASAQLSPVNILNEMPDTEELVCKGIKFKGLDIKNAIRLAVHLNHTGAVHHNKGVNKIEFPHYYGNMNGPNGQQYPFHEPVCRGRADWRAEFPVIKDGTFEDDSPAGIYRAIYHFNTVANKNPPGGVLQATYCGFIYHNGETDFKCCDNGDPFLPARLEGPLLQEPLGIAA